MSSFDKEFKAKFDEFADKRQVFRDQIWQLEQKIESLSEEYGMPLVEDGDTYIPSSFEYFWMEKLKASVDQTPPTYVHIGNAIKAKMWQLARILPEIRLYKEGTPGRMIWSGAWVSSSKWCMEGYDLEGQDREGE